MVRVPRLRLGQRVVELERFSRGPAHLLDRICRVSVEPSRDPVRHLIAPFQGIIEYFIFDEFRLINWLKHTQLFQESI